MSADRSVDVARAAVDHAERAAAEQERTARITLLREAASVSTLRAAVADPCSEIARLRAAIVIEAEKLDAALASSHAASAALAELGEKSTPIDHGHLLHAFYVDLVEAEPGTIGAVLEALPRTHALVPSRERGIPVDGAAQHAAREGFTCLANICSTLLPARTPDELQPDLRADLAAYMDCCRTPSEGAALLAARRKEREQTAAAAKVKPLRKPEGAAA